MCSCVLSKSCCHQQVTPICLRQVYRAAKLRQVSTAQLERRELKSLQPLLVEILQKRKIVAALLYEESCRLRTILLPKENIETALCL